VYKCEVFASLDGVERPDLVVIGVKSYSLDQVMDTISDHFGNDIPVMSVLNGVRHIDVISSRFPNAIFATIAFNAYRASQIAAVAVGGTAGLSAFDPKNKAMEKVRYILKRKISVGIAKNPNDAAHCKLVINLGNALLTIVGFHENRRRELGIVQQLMAEIHWEGVRAIRKAGIKEARVPGMPPWILLWASKTLPQFIILPIFEKKMRANSINSMAQDLESGSDTTELEDINGYLISLADKVGVEAPYNKALYGIFKEWVKGDRQPLKPSELVSRINSFSSL
jgi:2-dehydropantoate 2-reductase